MPKPPKILPLFQGARYAAVARGQGHGDSIRVRKTIGLGNYRQPKDVYLVYIGLDKNNQLAVRHMFQSGIDPNDIETIEATLVGYAKLPNSPRPFQIGKDFDSIDFRRRAYFTVVVDGPQWGFYYPIPDEVEPIKNEVHDPIVFIERKTLSGLRKAKNYSFYNAVLVTPDNCNGVRCINFFTDRDGRFLTRPTYYSFEIYLRIPFSETRAVGRHITVIIDPDGQNQGPPARQPRHRLGAGKGRCRDLSPAD